MLNPPFEGGGHHFATADLRHPYSTFARDLFGPYFTSKHPCSTSSGPEIQGVWNFDPQFRMITLPGGSNPLQLKPHFPEIAHETLVRVPSPGSEHGKALQSDGWPPQKELAMISRVGL